MYGIIDENKKFILLDSDRERLRTTALMLVQQTEKGCVQLYTEETVDKAIVKYATEEIETAYNGEKYLTGFVPAIDKEYQSAQRERAYTATVDTITAHISRLRDEEQTPETQEKIARLITERKAKVTEIKEMYPY